MLNLLLQNLIVSHEISPLTFGIAYSMHISNFMFKLTKCTILPKGSIFADRKTKSMFPNVNHATWAYRKVEVVR